MPKRKNPRPESNAEDKRPQPIEPDKIESRNRTLLSLAERSTAHLKGKTVLRVEYISREEMKANEWSSQAPVVVFTDGSCLILQSDAEGNSPGAGLFIGFAADGAIYEDMIYPI